MNEESNQDYNTEDLYEEQIIVVDPGQEPMRLDKFLMQRLEKVSRNRIQNAISKEMILVNDKPSKPSYKVHPNDTIRVIQLVDPYRPTEIEPENIPLDILYEDDSVLVLNKPAGMVVHPGVGNYSGTLVNALVYHHKNKLPVLQTNPPDRPGLVHRLDKDTSGLMITAKTDMALNHLARQFFNRTIKRSYRAIVWGGFEEKSGSIVGHIGRHPNDRLRMHVFKEGEIGKHAVTHFEVLEDYYYISLLECRLETGRTHQIRVHMAYAGHPVFNDKRYGGDKIRKGTVHDKYKQFVFNCFQICPRQALHASSLGFVHPVSGKSLYFECELPDDMSDLLKKWQKYFENKQK